MDEALVKFLHAAAQTGGRSKDGWRTDVLTNACKAVEKKCSFILKNSNVRGRLKTLKKEYNVAKECVLSSGFGFNNVTKTITCESGSWDDYIAAHPKSAYLQNKFLPNYEMLHIVVGENQATGAGQSDGFGPNDDSFSKRHPRSSNGAFVSLIDEVDLDDDVTLTQVGTTPFHIPGTQASPLDIPSSITPKAKRAKTRLSKNEDGEVKTAFTNMSVAALNFYKAFEAPDYTSLDAAVAAIPGLSYIQISRAMQMFFKDKEAAKCFLAIPVPRRVPMIYGMLGIAPETPEEE
ncbi:hypothetical protein ACHQM5_012487 [Ranunculus cassubicifolius]